MANWWEQNGSLADYFNTTPASRTAAATAAGKEYFDPFGAVTPGYQAMFDQGYTLAQDPAQFGNYKVGNFQTDPSQQVFDPKTGALFYPGENIGGSWQKNYDTGGPIGAFDLGMIIAALGSAGALAYGGAGAAAAGGAETGAGAIGADAGLGAAGGAGAGAAGAIPAWAPAQAGMTFNISMPWQAALMEAQTAAGAGLTAQEMISLGVPSWAAYAGSLPLPQIKGPSSMPSGGLSNLTKLGNVPGLRGGGTTPSISQPPNAIPSSTHNFQLWNPAQQASAVNPQLGQTAPVQSWANMIYGQRPVSQPWSQSNFAAMFQPQTGVMK